MLGCYIINSPSGCCWPKHSVCPTTHKHAASIITHSWHLVCILILFLSFPDYKQFSGLLQDHWTSDTNGFWYSPKAYAAAWFSSLVTVVSPSAYHAISSPRWISLWLHHKQRALDSLMWVLFDTCTQQSSRYYWKFKHSQKWPRTIHICKLGFQWSF